MTFPKRMTCDQAGAEHTYADYAVHCRVCLAVVWEGDKPPVDEQAPLITYAETVAGTACPSGVERCPHKLAVLAEQSKRRMITAGELTAVRDGLTERVAKLEGRRTGSTVLLALLAGWGITLRLVLLICVPLAAVVAIVALVVIYLGPIGVAALLGADGSGYGVKRFLANRRRRRARRS